MEQLWAYSLKTIQEENSIAKIPKAILQRFRNRQEYPPIRMSELQTDIFEMDNNILNNNKNMTFGSPDKNSKVVKIKILVPKGMILPNTNNINYVINDLSKNNTDLDLKITEENLPGSNEHSVSISSCEEVLAEIPHLVKRNNLNICSQVPRVNKNEFRLSDPLQTSTLRSNSSSIRERRNAIRSEEIFQRHSKRFGMPVMGRSALLSKVMHTDNTDLNDSKVVKELVLSKYQDILDHYRKRTLERKKSRMASLLLEDYDDVQQEVLNNEELKNEKSKNEELNNEELKNEDPAEDDSNEIYEEYDAEKNASNCSTVSYQSISFKTDNMEFMQSTDDLNKESTLGHCQSIAFSRDFINETVEYDSKAFLQAALGDEFKNVSISSFRGSSPLLNEPKLNCGNSSVNSSQISALLSKESSVYSMVSKRYRKTLPQLYDVRTPSYYEISANEHPKVTAKYEEITKELSIQNSILFQVSKALNLCKLTKEFCSSPERIEAERILLTTSCKIELLNEELLKLDYLVVPNDSCNFGTIEIRDIQFSRKSVEGCPNKVKTLTEYYVCILTNGSNVLASRVSTANNDGLIQFNELFVFSQLLSDFKIILNLFSMKVRNNMKNYSHESKFHLNEDIDISCSIPKKFFSLRRYSHKQNLSNANVEINPSAFTFCGKYTITLSNLNGPTLLENAPLSSSICSKFYLDIRSSVNLRNKMSGFLTISKDKGGCAVWNRHWCSLKGFSLHYWNYPCEENVTKHLGVIELNEHSLIGIAPRNICSRPKTLILENGTDKILSRYFLSADTLQELKMWEKQLSSLIISLRQWGCK